MNILILINYIIFAALFSLLLIELAGAIVSILDTDQYKKKVVVYLAPLWEITGTLSIFYLVNLVATYPGLIPTIDYLYIAPILIAAVFLIARDAYLAYSELSSEKEDDKKHARIYGILTVLTMLLLITVLNSSVSAGGVDPAWYAVNFSYLLGNGFNVLMIDSIIALASACAIVFFNLKYPKILAVMVLFSAAFLAIGIKVHVPYMWANIINNPLYLLPTIILFVIISAMYLIKNKYTRFLVIPLLFIGTLTFELLEYPYIFNGSLNLNNFITPQPTASYILLFTVLGGIFLIVSLTLFFYINHSKKKKKGR